MKGQLDIFRKYVGLVRKYVWVQLENMYIWLRNKYVEGVRYKRKRAATNQFRSFGVKEENLEKRRTKRREEFVEPWNHLI